MTTKVDEALAAIDAMAAKYPRVSDRTLDEHSAITLAAEVRRLRADGERLDMTIRAYLGALMKVLPNVARTSANADLIECLLEASQALDAALSAHKDQS